VVDPDLWRTLGPGGRSRVRRYEGSKRRFGWRNRTAPYRLGKPQNCGWLLGSCMGTQRRCCHKGTRTRGLSSMSGFKSWSYRRWSEIVLRSKSQRKLGSILLRLSPMQSTPWLKANASTSNAGLSVRPDVRSNAAPIPGRFWVSQCAGSACHERSERLRHAIVFGCHGSACIPTNWTSMLTSLLAS
jgi:hypothetical protein